MIHTWVAQDRSDLQLAESLFRRFKDELGYFPHTNVKPSRIVMATHQGTFAGALHWGQTTKSVYTIHRIAVDTPFQRLGIGARLVQDWASCVVEPNCTIKLKVRNDRAHFAALQFWPALGFVPVKATPARRPGFVLIHYTRGT